MALVYAAREVSSHRHVAVKVMQPELARQPQLLQRMMQEARAAAALHHPNVVNVIDVGLDDDGSAFIVLELLEGESFDERLQREGKLSPAETLRLLLPVIDAIHLAHKSGIIHRDIKPENVFLTTNSAGGTVPKLLDFGIAKLLDDSSIVTRTGSVLGTAGYMSPEQLRGVSRLTPASDVWAMGVMLFRTLSGRLPFDEDPNPAKMMIAMVLSDPPKLGEVDPALPPALCAAVDGALRRSPETRHRDMEELTEALVDAAKLDRIDLSDATPDLPAGMV